MDLLSKRDEIFKSAHRLFLKREGFALRSSRSEHHRAPLHLAVVLSSQAGNSQSHVDFDLSVVVAHDEFNPHKFLGVKPGLRLRDDSLLNLSLKKIVRPGAPPYWSIRSDDDLASVSEEIFDGIKTFALPILAQCGTLQGLVDIHASRNFRNFKASSWLLNRLGRREHAITVIETAIAAAPHERSRQAVKKWLLDFEQEASSSSGT